MTVAVHGLGVEAVVGASLEILVGDVGTVIVSEVQSGLLTRMAQSAGGVVVIVNRATTAAIVVAAASPDPAAASVINTAIMVRVTIVMLPVMTINAANTLTAILSSSSGVPVVTAMVTAAPLIGLMPLTAAFPSVTTVTMVVTYLIPPNAAAVIALGAELGSLTRVLADAALALAVIEGVAATVTILTTIAAETELLVAMLATIPVTILLINGTAVFVAIGFAIGVVTDGVGTVGFYWSPRGLGNHDCGQEGGVSDADLHSGTGEAEKRKDQAKNDTEGM
ncbi:hypothetical protein IWQ60_002297 [Tieghemiomyces parasiticus]|uniref:Uncharacterized protein n=1 Tax=Tieghemiomyces parasiticus TaxID=78921 RepID=A0A9W8AJA3_9FUNG|nr:hypothetical protein IWQ60_002297 [Tieghemiomyces parasiticus]